MPPRGFTLPSAKTDSARAARSAFFCSLCQKGYSRQNEFEAHESSYDHQHKKRLKEMKEMQRQAQPKAKEDQGPMVSVKLDGAGAGGGGAAPAKSTGGGGFKKGGFKNAFASVNDGDDEERGKVKEERLAGVVDVVMKDAGESKVEAEEDSDVTDEEDYYDPSMPTDCHPGCPAKLAAVAT